MNIPKLEPGYEWAEDGERSKRGWRSWSLTRGEWVDTTLFGWEVRIPGFDAKPIQATEPLPCLPDASEQTLDELFSEVAEFSIATFPTATLKSVATHIRREARELLRKPSDGEETADIVTLCIGMAARQGIDLKAEITAKLAKNRLRKWGAPDKDGVVEHIRGEGE